MQIETAMNVARLRGWCSLGGMRWKKQVCCGSGGLLASFNRLKLQGSSRSSRAQSVWVPGEPVRQGTARYLPVMMRHGRARKAAPLYL